jgi:transposase
VPDDQRFRTGRHYAAWLGLTLKQHSSGGKERLLGISKRGDAYMRRQFINVPVRLCGSLRDELAAYGNGSMRSYLDDRSTS